ncbi:MAG: hypothetical protein Q8M98_11845 [Candidatus Cloacimonadaceae bacterium]|nr:hypothetical protein [Candidatus Cloacimonadaceae bacterium]
MVKSNVFGHSVWASILLTALIFSACAKDKSASKPTGRDASYQEIEQKAASASAELEGKQTTKPAVTTPPKTATPAQSPTANIKSADASGIVVEIDTFRVFNDDVSLKEARSKTLDFVRQIALQKALPVDVSITSLTTDMYVERNKNFDESTARSIFMMSSSAGRFLVEKVISARPVFDGRSHSLRYHIQYNATIVPMEKTYNSHIYLNVKLSNTLLRNKEEFELSITPNTDGYLYIFDFLCDNSVAMVYPTMQYTSNRIGKDQTWRETLVAVADPNRDLTIETLYFVFATEPISGWEDFRSNKNVDDLVFSAGEESFMLFQKWLGRGDPSKRVEKMAQLHIFK